MPSSSASWIRRARTSTIFALPWTVSVTMPACEPVSEIASWPRSWITIAASAHEIRSPTETSMSSSRGCGVGETWLRELEQLVRRAPHRGEDADDAMPLLARGDEPRRDPLQLLRVADRRAAELEHEGAARRRLGVGVDSWNGFVLGRGHCSASVVEAPETTRKRP